MAYHYQIKCFSELRNRFPIWDDLKSFLESREGGSLIIKDSKTITNLCIIRYVKGVSDFDIPYVGWFRSVVWNTLDNMPVCVAPPKSIENTPDKYCDYAADTLVSKEFVEGTMINAFKQTPDQSKVHIATRSLLNANGTFYSSVSFDNLFNDALKRMNIRCEDCFENPKNDDTEYSTFASFVLQHPEHRIVKRIRTPNIKMVHTGVIMNDGTVKFNEGTLEWNTIHPELLIPEIDIPSTHGFRSLSSWVGDYLQERSCDYKGLVFQDRNGNRWRSLNTANVEVCNLRGNDVYCLQRFTRLRCENRVREYLIHYGEERLQFQRMEQQVRNITQQLFECYVSTRITKEKNISELKGLWRYRVNSLHNIYNNELRLNGRFVTKAIVIQYMNNLPSKDLYYLLHNAEYPWMDTNSATNTVENNENRGVEHCCTLDNVSEVNDPEPHI